MKKIVCVLIIVMLIASCSMPGGEQRENQVEAEISASGIRQLILDKEKEALNSWAEGSVLGYIKHFDTEATYMDDIGAQDRIDGLQALRAYAVKLDSMGMITKHRYEVIDPKVQVFKDFTILTLQYHPYYPDGTPGRKWKATNVYRFKDNDWKVVHAHWSMLKEQ